MSPLLWIPHTTIERQADMGNDGGSIPKRDDLVKTRAKDEQADKHEQDAARWFFCALSKCPLETPLASDPLGKLYNRSSALEYLLRPPAPDGSSPSAFGADADATASHLVSLKDLVTLKVTPNPAYAPKVGEDKAKGRWICPVSMKEVGPGNGKKEAGRWVYLRGCGCVATQVGIRQLRAGMSSLPEKECLICGEKYKRETDTETVTINPGEEEEEVMRAGLAARRRVEKEEKERKKREKKAAKEGKKRKGGGVFELESSAASIPPTGNDIASTKKLRLQDSGKYPHPTAPGPASKLATLIAAEAERKAKEQSAAVASIYVPRDKDGKQLLGQQQESWMTRGTWSRYA